MIKRLVLVGILIFTMSVSVFSYDNENIEYLYFDYNDVEYSGVIAYSLFYNENLNVGDVFKLDVFHNDEMFDVCEIKLDYSSQDIFEKITCDVVNIENGEYLFDAKIIRNDEIIFQVKNVENFFDKVKANIEFNVIGNKTEIIINVDGEGDSLRVYHEIPKSAIASLTEDNRNDLINTDFEFEIIEEDPLIAWNVEEIPTTINYTMNKKITREDMENFNVSITENEEFKLFKYIIVGLIILIVIISLKPIVKKKKNT